ESVGLTAGSETLADYLAGAVDARSDASRPAQGAEVVGGWIDRTVGGRSEGMVLTDADHLADAVDSVGDAGVTAERAKIGDGICGTRWIHRYRCWASAASGL